MNTYSNAYPLFAPKDGIYLLPTNCGNTVEYVMENENMTLLEHRIVDSCDNFKYRYRLHTRKPTLYEDTLKYDIGCPRCHTRLRLCGRPLDSYDHGLYRCPVCEKDQGGK